MRTVIISVTALLILLLSLASLLPLIETNAWWVRWLDFPRLQIALALAASLLLYLALGGLHRGGRGLALVALGVVALAYQGYKLHPYAPIVAPMAVAQGVCEEGSGLRLLVANLRRDNETAGPLLDLVAAEAPDVLLLMETDAWWDEALAPLAEAYPHAVQHIPADASYYGIHLLSRLPLVSPQVVLGFGPETPAIVTGLALPSGGTVRLHGLHPRPPLTWSQPTTTRDATLLRAALDAADSDAPSLVAGDFNAVPWERVTRRAMRLGGLLDPRVGRGFYPTYDVESVLKSWPLDHVLHQADFTLTEFRTLPGIGSDHAPVLAGLCLSPDAAALQSPPPVRPDDLAEAQASLAAAEAARRSDP